MKQVKGFGMPERSEHNRRGSPVAKAAVLAALLAATGVALFVVSTGDNEWLGSSRFAQANTPSSRPSGELGVFTFANEVVVCGASCAPSPDRPAIDVWTFATVRLRDGKAVTGPYRVKFEVPHGEPYGTGWFLTDDGECPPQVQLTFTSDPSGHRSATGAPQTPPPSPMPPLPTWRIEVESDAHVGTLRTPPSTTQPPDASDALRHAYEQVKKTLADE